MAIDSSTRLGLAGLVLGAVGVAVPLTWPDQRWLGELFIIGAAALVLIWTLAEIRGHWTGLLSVVISVVAACLILAATATLHWIIRRHKETTSPAVSAPPWSADQLAAIIADKLKEQSPRDSHPSEPSASSTSGGFVQFENKTILIPSAEEAQRLNAGDLRPGEIISIRYYYANRGVRPVSDVQTWEVVIPVEPAKNPVPRLRAVMRRAAQDGYKRFKGDGGDLGVGQANWATAVSPPLTSSQISGLKNGSLRLYLIICGAWSDEQGRPFYWVHIEWTNWPQVASIPMSSWVNGQ